MENENKMKTKEFESLKVGDVVKYANETAEYRVIEKMPGKMYKVQCTRRVAATAALWEKLK